MTTPQTLIEVISLGKKFENLRRELLKLREDVEELKKEVRRHRSELNDVWEKWG